MLKGSGGGFHSKVLANFYKNWILRPKAMVQAGKTLYSPLTQVRNVTAGTLFATMSGHIGHNASLGDSIRLVLRDIYKSGRITDEALYANNFGFAARLDPKKSIMKKPNGKPVINLNIWFDSYEVSAWIPPSITNGNIQATAKVHTIKFLLLFA